MIPTANYFRSDVLAEEMRTVFARGWQFVGLTSELSNNRDFLCLDLPGHAIVVQNFQGQLRAFRNVCAHRLSRLQIEDRGNRHLMCRYHGWTYGQSGAPLGLPARQGFMGEPNEKQQLCLKRYPVETRGRFVFVSLEESPPALAEYLGDFDRLLISLSEYIGVETHFGSVRHAANWKLLVENVLECYHCSIVHPETFVAGLGVGRKPIEDVNFSGPHSTCHFPRTEIKREGARRRLIAHLDARKFVHDSFFHVYIFPNLFISSTEGTAFYIGQALPVSGRETMLRVRFFEPNIELTDKARVRQDAINLQGRDLGLRVIDEDRLILESVQKGVEVSENPGVLGLDEIRIGAFMDSYMDAMSAA